MLPAYATASAYGWVRRAGGLGHLTHELGGTYAIRGARTRWRRSPVDDLWADARVRRDREAYDRLTADTFLGVGASGGVVTKGERLREVAEARGVVFVSITPAERVVRVYGDAGGVARHHAGDAVSSGETADVPVTLRQCTPSAQLLCDTKSHCMSVAEERPPSGECPRLSPIPTCVAGNGGVRSSG